MKKLLSLLLLFIFIVLPGCASNAPTDNKIQTENSSSTPKIEQKEYAESHTENDLNTERILYIKIGNSVLEAELADNTSAKALLALLRENDLTIEMSDYGNFEKVGELGTSLVTNDEQITTEAGDLILYQGNQFVIYYDTNSWNFTRLGKIKNISQDTLKSILGDGDVSAVLSIHKNTEKN
ncbi:MAG: hypothetical protein HFE77_03005 [Clostridiales bacterium]|nr:hypothetical protein [Clostridiales bacterium]